MLPETSVHIRTTRRYVPEDGNICSYHCENIRSTRALVYILTKAWAPIRIHASTVIGEMQSVSIAVSCRKAYVPKKHPFRLHLATVLCVFVFPFLLLSVFHTRKRYDCQLLILYPDFEWFTLFHALWIGMKMSFGIFKDKVVPVFN
jgi:hypothetical protein